MFPVGDSPNPKNFTPWVTWGLIAVNIAVYVLVTLPLSATGVDPQDPLLLQYLRLLAPSLPANVSLRDVLASLCAYDLFIFEHGFKPGAPGLDDLFASLFLHGGFWHLAGNMLFLWIYGDNVEHRLGRGLFLFSYLLTGALATLFFALFAPGSMTPLVGASGAISGVLGLYFLLFPRNKVKVLIFFFPFYMGTWLLPARLVLGIYLFVDNVLPFLAGSGSGVAYGAHIGGFLAGMGIAWGGERLAWRLPGTDTLRRRKAPAPRETTADDVRKALASGHPDRAIDAFYHLDRQDIRTFDPAECVTLAGHLYTAGFPVAATRLLRTCLSAHQDDPDLADVYLLLGLLRLEEGQQSAAFQYLLDALEHDPSPETATRARNALARIDMYHRRGEA